MEKIMQVWFTNSLNKCKKGFDFVKNIVQSLKGNDRNLLQSKFPMNEKIVYFKNCKTTKL